MTLIFSLSLSLVGFSELDKHLFFCVRRFLLSGCANDVMSLVVNKSLSLSDWDCRYARLVRISCSAFRLVERREGLVGIDSCEFSAKNTLFLAVFVHINIQNVFHSLSPHHRVVLSNLSEIISRFKRWWHRWSKGNHPKIGPFERVRYHSNMAKSNFQISHGGWVIVWFYVLPLINTLLRYRSYISLIVHSHCSNIDFGYDISDYRSIQPEYGTMEDFDQLIQKATELGNVT